MILVSVSRNNFHMSWVAYAHGHVIGRETRYYDEKKTVQSVMDLADYLKEAFKAVKGYLENPDVPYDLGDSILVEVGSTKLFKWISERDYASIYEDKALECLQLFNELSLPVKVVLNKNVTRLWADKYNHSKFVTSKEIEVVSALDWVSSLEG